MNLKFSENIVLQRIRNRIIEYLEMVSSYERQKAAGPNEVINQWEDWVVEPWKKEYVEPVFSRDEQQAIRNFEAIWKEAAENTPNVLPRVEELSELEVWQRLREDAEKALVVFSRRGKLSEDHEDT